MAKRVFLFVTVNILVVLTLSIVMQVLGVQPYLTAHAINYQSLAVFCLVWGMGGAFISLGISRIMVLAAAGIQGRLRRGKACRTGEDAGRAQGP